MKHLLLFVMLFFSMSVNAKQGEIISKAVDSKSTTVRVRRAPACTDLLLLVEDTGVTICFNGDFGPGYYQITVPETGCSVSGSVYAEAGSSEYVAFPITSETSFDFYIEFEDGSWSHLAWGNEEE